ncbi:hypothetical protein MARGE09_P3067 [Marinagarivorans cellulosilyticus]|uniref:Uncharacterized protein n=1 Tax=Marinagarivorans cellulosilyticus TaxID=2721545 RepID=A0AAN2BLC6_9GAMM|nr:hypothetical protein MARGE09_P3067 [Marinagarivorans cellulosilyticus]
MLRCITLTTYIHIRMRCLLRGFLPNVINLAAADNFSGLAQAIYDFVLLDFVLLGNCSCITLIAYIHIRMQSLILHILMQVQSLPPTHPCWGWALRTRSGKCAPRLRASCAVLIKYILYRCIFDHLAIPARAGA